MTPTAHPTRTPSLLFRVAAALLCTAAWLGVAQPAHAGTAIDFLDPDMDGFMNYVEFALGSDRNNPASTPEALSGLEFGPFIDPRRCSDDIDNDQDGLVDQ